MDFSDWLVRELRERGWSNSELARRAGVVPSTISMVISGQQNPGPELCLGVARAFGMEPEQVMRLAGLVPRRPERSEIMSQIEFYFDQMDDQTQRQFLTIAYALANRGNGGENSEGLGFASRLLGHAPG